MSATALVFPAIDHSEADRNTQRQRILELLRIGDDQASQRLYREATLTYYSIFDPSAYGQPGLGLTRLAPLEFYVAAATGLRAVATPYAEKLMECGCFLAGESHDGIIGVPRGALNLYLISNQYDVFTKHALQYAVEEQTRRDISRFLMSAVRARLEHLRHVDARAPLLSEERQAFDALADFKTSLHAYLAPRRRAPGRSAGTM